MDQYLKMNDGTILAESKAMEGVNGLYVNIQDPDTDLITAFGILSDPNKTKKIVYHYYKADLTFEGYTKIKSIQDEGAMITAMLLKGEDEGNGENGNMV